MSEAKNMSEQRQKAVETLQSFIGGSSTISTRVAREALDVLAQAPEFGRPDKLDIVAQVRCMKCHDRTSLHVDYNKLPDHIAEKAGYRPIYMPDHYYGTSASRYMRHLESELMKLKENEG